MWYASLMFKRTLLRAALVVFVAVVIVLGFGAAGLLCFAVGMIAQDQLHA